MTDAYVSFLQGINTRSFSRAKSKSISAQSESSSCPNDSLSIRCHSQESFVDLGQDYQDVLRRGSSLPSLDQVVGYYGSSPTNAE